MQQEQLPGIPRARVALKKRTRLNPQPPVPAYRHTMYITDEVIELVSRLNNDVEYRNRTVMFVPSATPPNITGFYLIRPFSGSLAVGWFDREQQQWVETSTGLVIQTTDFLYWAGLWDPRVGRRRRTLISRRGGVVGVRVNNADDPPF